MYYDKENDRYFNDEYEAFEYWHELGSPSVLYETKGYVLNEYQKEMLAELVKDFVDNEIPEAGTEDEYFSDLLANRDRFKEEIAKAVQDQITTVEPDYSKKAPMSSEYHDWLLEEGLIS